MQSVVEGFRLSPQQRRLCKLQQDANGDGRAFASQLVLSLEGELRVEAFRASLERVCARHESLRTTFRRLPGVAMPVQSVSDDLAPAWQTIDLGDSDDSAPLARVDELLAQESRRQFDIENGPLVQATLFVLAADRHLLSVTLPALCADRRTLTNLFLELAQEVSDEEPFQYLQFSEWQNSLSEEEDAAKGKEYWTRQDLSSLSVSSVLFPGHASRAKQSEALQSVTLHSSPVDTSSTVLLAAWQTLLRRLTQQPVVIGNICEGRSYELLHDAFGLFARVLPACSQSTENLRFSEVVAQIDGFQHESEEWQDYFDLDQHFSFGFEYAEQPRPQKQNDLQVSVQRQHSHFELFDLKLSCVATNSAIELTFEYDSALFDEAYVHHLAEQFQTLLSSALEDPETVADDLDIVSSAERQRLVVEWNDTKRDYDLDRCIHEVFEEQVEHTPSALAVVFQEQQLTFAELNQRANQLAHYLQAQGVGPETPVGICLEPSLEMIVAVLGILKAGGAYVPLDPRNPKSRIDQLVSDAGIAILLTREELAQVRDENTDNPPGSLTAENLAYIIYTSGSTGQPKGVMVQHRSVLNLAAALRDEVYAGLGPGLRVGLSAPLAFDASVKQLVQLLSGHTLYLLPEDLRLDAARALDYIDHHALDVLDCTPAQLKLLLAAGLNKDTKHTPKLMLVGGEALDELTWSRVAEDQRTRFYNVYGPTECTVDATWTRLTSGQQPNIGRPIPNAQTCILDQNLRPAGIHVTGELYISGEGLARGYFNSPERTAERFIPGGLSGRPGARLYRTGDLARYLPDGSISFIGRNDTQIKVRGHRIELGEIEAVLRQHEKVQEAVVVAREDRKGDVRLVGYLVTHDGEVDVTEFRRALSERLPDYMVPSFLVTMDELPLTRNGKVDLAALPAPEAARRSRDENYVAPRNEIEAAIARVWQEALSVERIGVNDNFFDAGGHSLLMVQVHNKLSEMFDKQISIVEMFAKPTISALAEYFSETNGHKPTFERAMNRAARRRQAVSMRQ
ncbi:MAG TPA: amino acid adenylation domain-containing protein [Pyrinomonadaceae bacterium]|jgi:amino acid adenylation domain-containing protein